MRVTGRVRGGLYMSWYGGNRPKNEEEKDAMIGRMKAAVNREGRFEFFRNNAGTVSDLLELFTDNLTAGMFDSYLVGEGATEAEIVSAQQALGIVFSGDYQNFLKTCGYLLFEPNYQDFHGHLYGLSEDPSMSVVVQTVDGRKNGIVPGGFYVIDCLTGVPGCDLVLQVPDGQVYIHTDTGVKYCCGSLIKYMRAHMRSTLH